MTNSAHALLRQLAPVLRQVNDVQFAPLTAAEFARLGAMTERLIASADEALALQKYLSQWPNLHFSSPA